MRRLGEVDVVAGEMGGREVAGGVEEPDPCAGADVGDAGVGGERGGYGGVDGEVEGGFPEEMLEVEAGRGEVVAFKHVDFSVVWGVVCFGGHGWELCEVVLRRLARVAGNLLIFDYSALVKYSGIQIDFAIGECLGHS